MIVVHLEVSWDFEIYIWISGVSAWMLTKLSCSENFWKIYYAYVIFHLFFYIHSISNSVVCNFDYWSLFLIYCIDILEKVVRVSWFFDVSTSTQTKWSRICLIQYCTIWYFGIHEYIFSFFVEFMEFCLVQC